MSFTKFTIVKDMSVRTDTQAKQERIDFNISFLNAPCHCIPFFNSNF